MDNKPDNIKKIQTDSQLNKQNLLDSRLQNKLNINSYNQRNVYHKINPHVLNFKRDCTQHVQYNQNISHTYNAMKQHNINRFECINQGSNDEQNASVDNIISRASEDHAQDTLNKIVKSDICTSVCTNKYIDKHIIPDGIIDYDRYIETEIQPYKLSVNLSKMTILNIIGRGSFGKVVECDFTDYPDIRRCAVKMIDKTTSRFNRKYVNMEIFLQTHLEHPGIVRCFGWCETISSVYILMNKIDGVNLHLLSRTKPNMKFPIEEIKHYSKQLLDTLCYLNSKHVVHCDIKPENIIIEQSTSKVYICDFGLSNIIRNGCSDIKLPSAIGSRDFISPEMVKGKLITTTTDLWSFGVTLYEMAYGRIPFTHKSHYKTSTNNIKTCTYTVINDIKYDELNSLLQRIFTLNAKRIDIITCSEDSFFKNTTTLIT